MSKNASLRYLLKLVFPSRPLLETNLLMNASANSQCYTVLSVHRLLLLKLDKQIGGTIYRPTLAANEACHMEGVGCPVGGGRCKIGGVGAMLEGVGCDVGGGGVSHWRGWVQ